MEELLVLTDRVQAGAVADRTLLDVIDAAVEGGARAVLLREKDLPRSERHHLGTAIDVMLEPVDGRLLVASDTGLAAELHAAGVHLSAADPPLSPDGTPELVGRSCHTLADLRAARDEGVDYVTFSPVWATASKPGYGPALGLDGLAAACATVPELAVYALGGVAPGRVAGCRTAGAAGIAVMGGIMRAEDPTKLVRRLLEEWWS